MILQSIFRVLLALLLLFSLNTTGQASGSAAAHAPLEKVSLQLKWLHQFQFAGYYAAQTQGFYAEEGLDVTIRPRDLFKNNIQQVLDGEAQYGVADNILLLYRARGEPVVIVAPILQHSPQTLVTLQSSGIRSPYDLDNRNIAFYQHDVDGFALLAMFEQLGIHPKLKRVKVEADPAMLARGDVSAYPGYLSNEPFLLQQQGHAINLIRPASYGIDLYGDMLFTTQQELDRHPDRVARFKRATLKGWHYALQHKQELAEYIRQHLNPSKSLAHLLYEAEAIEALVAAKTVPIGTLDEGRLRYIGDLFVKHGLLDTPLSLEQGVYRPSQGELTFSAREQAWIREHPLIRVAVDREWRPIEFVDEHGRLNGLSAGFLGYLSQKTGLRFEPATDLDWPQAVAAMKRRELDLYSAVSEAPGRSDYVSFTAPYLQFPMVIATQRDATYISDLRQLKDQQLAVVTDYAAHAILNTHYPDLSLHQVNTHYPDLSLHQVNTPLEGLHAVSQGQAYAYIDNLAVISHLINQHNLSNLQISGEMPFRADVSMAIRSD
jgi:polar amino acid transport system substrate-binding protein